MGDAGVRAQVEMALTLRFDSDRLRMGKSRSRDERRHLGGLRDLRDHVSGLFVVLHQAPTFGGSADAQCRRPMMLP